jgi:hypothetical protein
MSAVRFPARPARIVTAWLRPWEPGVPGIAYQYDDGLQVTADATINTPQIAAAIKPLSPEDRERLEAAFALHHSWCLCRLASVFDPAKADRKTIVELLAHGEFAEPIIVMEVDLPAGVCRDVTNEIMEEAEIALRTWWRGDQHDRLAPIMKLWSGFSDSSEGPHYLADFTWQTSNFTPSRRRQFRVYIRNSFSHG